MATTAMITITAARTVLEMSLLVYKPSVRPLPISFTVVQKPLYVKEVFKLNC
jgi:hypothetical protein